MSDTMNKSDQEKKEKTQESAEKELQTCQLELEQLKEKFVHVAADLENFTRRINKERMQWAHRAQELVFLDMLSIIDDFDRSLEEQKKVELSKDMQAWLSGFNMIGSALTKLLEKYDVKEITEVQVFDPSYHEALMQVDSPDHESGEIVQVMQKGYRFKESVLRPAKVSVAK